MADAQMLREIAERARARRFEELVFIGLSAYRKWRRELEMDGSDVTIADRNMAGLIVALRAALAASQEQRRG